MTKYLNTMDIQLKDGRIAYTGTVFYKNANGSFAPWFDRSLNVNVPAQYLVKE